VPAISRFPFLKRTGRIDTQNPYTDVCTGSAARATVSLCSQFAVRFRSPRRANVSRCKCELLAKGT
jgi:hypothetical protein